MTVTLIITFILVLLVTVFGFQNGMPVEVKFFIWNIQTSLIAVIFGSALLGALIVAVLSVPKLVSKHFREKKLKKKLDGVARLSKDSEQSVPPSV